MLILYRIAFAIVAILSSPFLLAKALWGHHGIRERLGFVPERKSSGRLFWFHAASVGELKVLLTIIPELEEMIPGLEIAISTTTATGKKRALELFGDSARVFYQPLEINSAILRAIENLRPEKLILVETEIWPLMITTSAECGIEVYLINARLSKRSRKFYGWLRPLFKPALMKFERVLAQTETDAQRFASIGAPDPEVIGNIKFDQVLNIGKLRKPSLNLRDKGRLIFVAGSVRKGEDRIFADLIARSMAQNLPVFYILVPRHMKDLDELCDNLKYRGIQSVLWSECRGKLIDSNAVLVVNTMGELTGFYTVCDLAFVGGSLVPIGGHDPAEPAALGKPVVFGPYMENARLAARLLVDSGGATVVKNEGDLLSLLQKSVADKGKLAENGRKCREAILSMSGASKKIACIIAEDKK